MGVHAYNPSTWEAETGESQVGGQPQQLRKALRNLVRPCFKIKNKIGLRVKLRGRMPLGLISSTAKTKQNKNKTVFSDPS